tara:strand:+ start:4794 stop:7232 length:2439 start_codon:yes stop_codon:yes gene_type:complete
MTVNIVKNGNTKEVAFPELWISRGWSLVEADDDKSKSKEKEVETDNLKKGAKKAKKEPIEINPTIDEADKSKGRPRGAPHIQNSRFWDLPNSSLKFIAKDAHEAMIANPTSKKATGKWADEVNDAVTVLSWRKKKGINEEQWVATVGSKTKEFTMPDGSSESQAKARAVSIWSVARMVGGRTPKATPNLKLKRLNERRQLPRQLKDPKTETLVVKNGKTKVVDKKEVKAFIRNGWKLAEELIYERDYARERANYHGTPKQMERNRARKRARYAMEKAGKVKNGDKMDVHHKDNNPLNNDPKNLAVQTQAVNRAEPRLRDAGTSDLGEAKVWYAIIHKKDREVLSTLDSREEAEDERQSLKDPSQYTVRKTKKGPRQFSMKETNNPFENMSTKDIEKFLNNSAVSNSKDARQREKQAMRELDRRDKKGIKEDSEYDIDMMGTRGSRGVHSVSARTEKEAQYKVRRKEGLGKQDVHSVKVTEPETEVQEMEIQETLSKDDKAKIALYKSRLLRTKGNSPAAQGIRSAIQDDIDRIMNKAKKNVKEETIQEGSASRAARDARKAMGREGMLSRKDAADVDDDEEEVTSGKEVNIIMQLRKVVSLRGQKPVQFRNGKKEKVNPKLANQAMAKFQSLRGADAKEAFMKKISSSHDGLKKAVSEGHDLTDEEKAIFFEYLVNVEGDPNFFNQTDEKMDHAKIEKAAKDKSGEVDPKTFFEKKNKKKKKYGKVVAGSKRVDGKVVGESKGVDDEEMKNQKGNEKTCSCGNKPGECKCPADCKCGCNTEVDTEESFDVIRGKSEKYVSLEGRIRGIMARH